MRVNNTPFTFYDIFGYFIPGLVLISFFIYDFGLFSNILKIFDSHKDTYADEFFMVFVYIVSCYVVGHIFSFLSTFFIEDIVRYLYGPPGCYFMMSKDEQVEDTEERFKRISDHEEKIKKEHPPSKALYRLKKIFFFPHSLILCICKKCICSYVYSSRIYGPDDFNFKACKVSLMNYLNENEIKINNLNYGLSNKDYLVEKANNSLFMAAKSLINYETEKQSVYNYLILSGMTRSLAFVCQCIAWWYVLRLIFGNIYQFLFLIFPIWVPEDNWRLAGIIITVVLSNILTLMYLKFDRRYAEEIITAIIHHIHNSKKSKNTSN